MGKSRVVRVSEETYLILESYQKRTNIQITDSITKAVDWYNKTYMPEILAAYDRLDSTAKLRQANKLSA